MGWSSGTEVFLRIYEKIRKVVPRNKQKEIARELIEILRDFDWDCIEEVEGKWKEVDELIAEYSENEDE